MTLPSAGARSAGRSLIIGCTTVTVFKLSRRVGEPDPEMRERDHLSDSEREGGRERGRERERLGDSTASDGETETEPEIERLSRLTHWQAIERQSSLTQN